MSDPTSPTTPDAAAPDVLAAANLRRVRAMYDAAPPEGSDGGDRTPPINRVLASLAGGYSTLDLDPRDVRCLAVAFDDAEGIIDALNADLAEARRTIARLRAPAADLAAIEARAAAATPCAPEDRAWAPHVAKWREAGTLALYVDELASAVVMQEAEVEIAHADVTTLLALLAAEREGRAAEVAGARAAAQAERDMWQAQIATTTDDAAAALDMVDDLVRHALLHHPLPWRIEDDWTREVTAADGAIVAKCMTFPQAEAIIATATRIRAELDAPDDVAALATKGAPDV